MRIIDLEGNQAVDFLVYNADDPAERYSAPDTIVEQGNIFLVTGSRLMSNEGRPLMTVTATTCARHDTIGGACSQESNTLRYGFHTKQQHACVENFLLALSEHGMGKRDMTSNINWFMNVPVEPDGTLGIVDGISAPGSPSICARRWTCSRSSPTARRSTTRATRSTRLPFASSSSTDVRRVLIANRGEIACRIIRTLDRMGLESVAVYSEAERDAMHVSLATHRIEIGPAPPANSYLSLERVLGAAEQSGADAMHPGYGFLAEHAEFAAAVERAGLAFIGPTPDQLRAFGAKDTARALAAEAGVPLLPGSPAFATLDDAERFAPSVGFPLLVKSVAGGGGIGMVRCDRPEDLADAVDARDPAGRAVVRRSQRVSRATGRARAPHRGAGVRRRHGSRVASSAIVTAPPSAAGRR